MKERQTINTNLRLNLANEDDRRAWTYLQNMDRKRYKSYSRAIVIAVNDYFDRQARLDADPYLETREKENAFLHRIQDTIERSLRDMNRGAVLQIVQGTSSVAESHSDQQDFANENFDTAMDFINGL